MAGLERVSRKEKTEHLSCPSEPGEPSESLQALGTSVLSPGQAAAPMFMFMFITNLFGTLNPTSPSSPSSPLFTLVIETS